MSDTSPGMQESFDHILVPVDFTKKNERAIEIAKRLATEHSARVSLLHVIESLDFPEDEEVQQFLNKMEARSNQQLAQLKDRFGGNDLEVSSETVIHNRAGGIVLYALENGVDLIVMSSHKIEPGATRDDWATISYQVSLACPCSIMLVKPAPSDQP